MPITADQIVLRASRVMADVPEGGGGPSATEIESGVSNNIFPDISDADRAGGHLALRQLHLAVASPDTDVVMGCNAIVARPPDDPNVSILLMATEHDFARRAEDMKKLQSGFLASGTYPGELFGAHVSGQQVLMLIQREETPPPIIGARLALIFHEGQADEFVQYVSVQRIVSNNMQTFTDHEGDYQRRVVSVELGQALQRNFPGFDAQRQTISQAQIAQRTRVRSTVWAPAARYYGVKPLTAQAALGAFTVQTSGIYERLVPSAEAESPIADARVSGQSAALIQSGNLLSYTTNVAFAVGVNLFIGAAVVPGSLALVRGGQLMTDEGGRLVLGGVEVGRVDYASGICSLAVAGFPATGPLQITYAPAVQLTQDVASTGIAVTATSRRLNYVLTLPFAVARGSVRVHYRVMDRWYVLADDGSGAISDGDASHGAGQYNHSTRTLTVTLGALPDVNSAVIVQYVRDDALEDEGNHVDLLYPRFCIPINSDGDITDAAGSKPFAPGHVQVQWSAPGAGGAPQQFTASDDGNGVMTGDADGTVDYQHGRVVLMPHQLPPMGTVMTVRSIRHERSAQALAWSGSGAQWNINLGQRLQPGTLRAPLSVTLHAGTTATGYAHSPSQRTLSGYVSDNSAGQLLFHGVVVGSVNHSSGVASIDITTPRAEELARTVGFDVTRVGRVTIS